MSKDESIGWMYDGAKGSTHREDYLLGKKVDKNFEKYSDVVNSQKAETIDSIISTRTVFNSGQSTGIQTSSLQKDIIKSEDPFVAVKVREETKRRELMDNPLMKMRLQSMLKTMMTSKNEKKKEKKAKKDKKKKKKKRSRSSSSSSSDDDDSQRLKKNKRSPSPKRKRRTSGSFEPKSVRRRNISSERGKDNKVRQRSRSGSVVRSRRNHRSRSRSIEKFRKNQRSRSRSVEKNRRNHRSRSIEKSRKGVQRERSRSLDKSRNNRPSSRSPKRHHSRSRSPDRTRGKTRSPRQQRARSFERRAHSPKRSREETRKSRSRSRSTDQPSSNGNGSRKFDSHIPHHLQRRHDSSSDNESDHKNRKGQEGSDDEKEDARKKSYGLVEMRKRTSEEREEAAKPPSKEYKLIKIPTGRGSGNATKQREARKVLTEEEKAARLAEMEANVKWREEVRETNVAKRKVEDEEEKEEADKTGYAPSFIRSQMREACDDMTVEKRLQSNKRGVQRSHGYMDRSFAKK